jgi:hypothetical protein
MGDFSPQSFGGVGGNIPIGTYDQVGIGQGWAEASLVVVGADGTATTCFPLNNLGGSSIPPGCALPGADDAFIACQRVFAAHNQATPLADTSRDFFSGPQGGYFTVGVITNPYATVRSPNGDTITAQWYIDGSPVGGTTTFNNTYHAAVALPSFQYHISNYIRSDTLTLRLSGGLAHIASIVFLPRTTHTLNAIDYIDPAATITSSVADSMSTSGGNVVELVTGGVVIDPTSPERVLLFDPVPIVDERIWWISVLRTLGTVESQQFYGDFGTFFGGPGYTSNPIDGAHNWAVWRNNVREYNGHPYGETYGTYTAFSPNINGDISQRIGMDLETNILLDGGLIFAATDELTLRINVPGGNLTPFTSHADQIIFGRRIETMNAVPSPAVDQFDLGDTFALTWDYMGPIVQGPPWWPVDRSDLLTTVDGEIYDYLGNLVYTELGISNPWIIDTTIVGTGNLLKAIVKGNLDDGSYAFSGWEYDVGVSAGQIYRRLPAR